ncbi:MAG: hypothetical protein KAY61_00910 [Candidatus Eisenbacteria bacterium]|jgi:hypothetical protein|nr:hypothetical protein [Candidatus Eisenbacteria bacterium]MBP8136733.1 hypothetical protein [Candidatus Eisenbacteria bacterium]
MSDSHARIEPPAATLDAARRWLTPVREALGPEFLSAYLTGSVLTQGFDAAHSRINILVIARALEGAVLDRIATAIPETRKPPHFDPLFLTRDQMLASLDVFPIEWLDLSERHLRLEGEDVFGGVEVPRTYLRLQCEHELRGKHIRLRQEYLASAGRADRLAEVLSRLSSGFHTIFRTLLRLRGDEAPAQTEALIERVADAYGLDARALLGAHLLRRAGAKKPSADTVRDTYRAFLREIDRLIAAIDGLRTT